VQAMSGATPYVRWGNSPVVGLALLVFLGAGLFAFGRQSSKRKGESV
jgi:apolipoprotein N-acyltransferase